MQTLRLTSDLLKMNLLLNGASGEDTLQAQKPFSLPHCVGLTPRSLRLSAQVQMTPESKEWPETPGAPSGGPEQRGDIPVATSCWSAVPPQVVQACPHDRHELDILRPPQKPWGCSTTSGQGDGHRTMGDTHKKGKCLMERLVCGFVAHWLWGSLWTTALC